MHGRLSGRTLQGIGAALMIVALAGALSTGAWADASFLAPMRAIVVAIVPVTSGSPGPSPTASTLALPSATPTPKSYSVPRGGRLQMSLTGSMSFGARQSSQTLYNSVPIFGPSPSPSASPQYGSSSVSQGSASGNVGMLADFTRRTARTSLDFRFPFGFSSNAKANFGAFALMYSTSQYALGYGAQSLSVLGQLPTGSTIRGPFLIVPAPGGDLMFADGPTFGAGGEIVPLEAIRYRGVHGREIYEASFMRASGPQTGKSETALFGAATARGAVTAIGEVAFQQRPGGDATPTGPTYQVRVDDGSFSSYFTAVHRHNAQGFVSYGGGELNGDDFTSLGYRQSGNTSFTLDTSQETLGSTTPGVSTTVREINSSYGGPYRLGSYAFNVTTQKTSSTETPDQWNGSASTQLSAQIGHGFLLLSNVMNRQIQQGVGTIALVGNNVQFQQPFHNYALGFSFASQRQTSKMSGPTTGISEGISLSRQYRKTGIGINEVFGRTDGDLSDAFTRNMQVYVSRQLSPVIAIQATYTLSAINDRLNPNANGKSSAFSLQINAPFSFGNGIVTGRTDPHLPATIMGRVLMDVSENAAFQGLVSNGLNNVQVVLDDKIVQRTDLTGNFQFSFVSPGQHQLRIENASLPRGVTVDVPVYTLTLEGGQTAQVSFLVGSFGGIQGHVYGRDDHGNIVPLPNVMLRVDGGTYSQTDTSGAYGFGKLRPGKHTVAIIDNTVPAFASFDSKHEKFDVDVRNGVYTDVDFRADPLGSIAGTVTFDKQSGDVGTGGVANAYVVAEPGEHAAIVDADGSFLIDNVPPGDYTVSVDSETIPADLGVGPDSLAISLGSQEHYQGAAFVVGHMHKKVVFSFSSGGSSSENAPSLPKVRISEGRLPPRGSATITVDAPFAAEEVVASAFGESFKLGYSASRKAWVGEILVPTNVKAGPYDVTARVKSGTQPEASSITVDAKMPVAIMQTDPPNPAKGTYVRVRARFLVDVKEGDTIRWEDGQVTTLGRPLVGRVFTFNVRVSLRPLHGLLLTRVGGLPISLM